MSVRSLVLGLVIACSLGLSAEAQTASPPDYPNVKMYPNGAWSSVQPEMDGDGDALYLVLGADLTRYAANARTDNLNGGSTEAYAERMQRFAANYPLMYSFAFLENQASTVAQRAFETDSELLQISVRLVVRTGHDTTDLQEHLIESFTCTQAEAPLCVSNTFDKLQDFATTPWFKQNIRSEADRNLPEN